MFETQVTAARRGTATEAMKQVAAFERREVEFIRERVADGRIVIPANIRHTSLRPVGIGRELRTKINANIGNSMLSSCAGAERNKLRTALRYGADTVMDLSTGGDIPLIRKSLIADSTAPLGTVPIYELVARYHAEGISEEHLLEVISEQAEQGVDYMTIHAGLLRDFVPVALKRRLGIVSRGGALLAAWMTENLRENPFYTAFDRILEICLRYDVTLSLGDGLRPGCLSDAGDRAQYAELEVLGELAARCRAAGVQVMIEGPGHVPADKIEEQMRRERELCNDAPFYILGPLVTDCAPGYDHLTGAMGGLLGAMYGAAMLCYVTPKEHLGLPNAEDVRRGIVAFKIAAHAADVATGKPGAMEPDNAISDARAAFDWEKQFDCAIDPERARAYREEAIREAAAPPQHGSEFCTMCGPDFCSVRLSRKLKEAGKDEKKC